MKKKIVCRVQLKLLWPSHMKNNFNFAIKKLVEEIKQINNLTIYTYRTTVHEVYWDLCVRKMVSHKQWAAICPFNFCSLMTLWIFTSERDGKNSQFIWLNSVYTSLLNNIMFWKERCGCILQMINSNNDILEIGLYI